MASGGGRNFNFKVVLLGEGCVGKTSCVLRYVENKFNDKHLTTLQVIFVYLYIGLHIEISVKHISIFHWGGHYYTFHKDCNDNIHWSVEVILLGSQSQSGQTSDQKLLGYWSDTM